MLQQQLMPPRRLLSPRVAMSYSYAYAHLMGAAAVPSVRVLLSPAAGSVT
jgi:hypothetical protein